MSAVHQDAVSVWYLGPHDQFAAWIVGAFPAELAQAGERSPAEIFYLLFLYGSVHPSMSERDPLTASRGVLFGVFVVGVVLWQS